MEASRKETWARVRMENVSKEGKNGFSKMLCRVCNEEQETIGHVWTCKKAGSKMSGGSKVWIVEWTEGRS